MAVRKTARAVRGLLAGAATALVAVTIVSWFLTLPVTRLVPPFTRTRSSRSLSTGYTTTSGATRVTGTPGTAALSQTQLPQHATTAGAADAETEGARGAAGEGAGEELEALRGQLAVETAAAEEGPDR
jgi:hypothetical protein